MAKEPRSLGGAGLSLLVAMSGSLLVLLAEAGSWPMVALLLGLVTVFAGVTALCAFVYRHSRSTGDGLLRSLGRTAKAAVRLLVDLIP